MTDPLKINMECWRCGDNLDRDIPDTPERMIKMIHGTMRHKCSDGGGLRGRPSVRLSVTGRTQLLSHLLARMFALEAQVKALQATNEESND